MKKSKSYGLHSKYNSIDGWKFKQNSFRLVFPQKNDSKSGKIIVTDGGKKSDFDNRDDSLDRTHSSEELIELFENSRKYSYVLTKNNNIYHFNNDYSGFYVAGKKYKSLSEKFSIEIQNDISVSGDLIDELKKN